MPNIASSSAINDAPVISTVIPDQGFAEDGYVELNLTNYITDVDDATLTYTPNPTGNVTAVVTTVGNDQILNISGLPGLSGTGALDFTVTDTTGDFDNQTSKKCVCQLNK